MCAKSKCLHGNEASNLGMRLVAWNGASNLGMRLTAWE